MKYSIIAATALVLIACNADGTAPGARSPQQQKADFGEFADAFTSGVAALQIPDTVLSFRENLANLGTANDLASQREFFESQRVQLAKFDTDALSICEQIDHAIIAGEIDRGAERAILGERFLEFEEEKYSGENLAETHMGKDWYRHYLARWNGNDIDPDELFVLGELWLAKSVADYDMIIDQMGFDKNPVGLENHFNTNEFLSSNRDSLMSLFLKQQQTVRENIARLFYSDYDVPLANIVLSDRGADFPVPGWYDRESGTFFFNIFEEKFDLRQADWLFMHEATPGHHFQISVSAQSKKCERRSPDMFVPAYVEGWAAYVETLGPELGLQITPGDRLAAIEWDMVRSARVALDVALNYYGWSDEEALTYWRENVRGQEDVALREIARMKRWPAQVVTYKYGADAFGRMRQRFAGDGDPKSIRAYHDVALTYGSMPIPVFEALAAEMLKAKK